MTLTDTARVRPLARQRAHWASDSLSTHVVSSFIRPASSARGRNLSGRDQTERRVGPANQRFDGEDLAGAQVELGLVVQHEAAVVDRDRAVLRRRLSCSSPPSISWS